MRGVDCKCFAVVQIFCYFSAGWWLHAATDNHQSSLVVIWQTVKSIHHDIFLSLFSMSWLSGYCFLFWKRSPFALQNLTFRLAIAYLSFDESSLYNKHNWIFRIRLAENSRLEVFSMCPCDRYTVYDGCRKQKRWSPKGDNTALFFSDSQLEFKEAPWTSRRALPWKQRLQTCQPARRPWRKGW